jgi:ferrous iron transport protein A
VEGPIPLSDVPLRCPVRLLAMPEQAALRERLLAMGVQPGSNLEVVRRGFPGGILHVRMGLLEFMLRRRDATQMITLPAGASSQP